MRSATHVPTLLLICFSIVAFGCGAEEEVPPPPPPPGDEQPAGEGGALTVASFGGAWQDAQRRAMFEPFAASSGVKVVDVEYDGSYGRAAIHRPPASPPHPATRRVPA
jgi:putative spermidine/putrescine transport system substrate-binding protein